MGQPPDLQRHLFNRLSDNDSDTYRWLQGAILGLIINALYLEHLEEGAYAHLGDATTPRDVKIYASVLWC